MRVLLAGGGSAGHTSPLLATADALRRLDPDVEITCLGTRAGLETRVVPEAGYPLELIPPVPLPRRPSADLLRGAGPAARAPCRPPSRWSTGSAPTSSSASAATSRCRPTSPPARRRLPLVVHESNAAARPRQQARRPDRRTGSPPASPTPRCRRREYVGPADPPDDLDPRPGRAARRGACALRARPRPARRCWSPAARRARAGSTSRSPAPPRALADGRRPGAARRRPARASASPEPTGVPYVVARLRRPDGPRLRRRRRCALPGRRQHRHRGRGGRPAGDLRPAADRQRRAGAQRRARSSTPAAALLVADAALTPEWVAATRARPARPTPTGCAAMGAAAAGADPARRRREAGADRPRRRAGGADEDPGPRRDPPGRPARPRPLRRHRRRRPVRHRPDHGWPAASPSPAATTTTPRSSPALRELGVTCHLGYDAAHVGDADTLVVTTAAREDNPEVLEARAARAADAAAVGRPGRGDGRPPGGRGRRHARQDHDHLAAHRRAAGRRRRPVVRRRRRARPRPAATPTPAAATCSWPRPTRATAPSSSTAPHAAIVTNVEADHLDNWGTEEAYHAAFDEFVDTIDPDGLPRLLRRRPRRRRPGRRRPRARARGRHASGSRPTPTARHDLVLDGSTSAFDVIDGADLGESRCDPRPPLRPRRARRAGHRPAARLRVRRPARAGSAASPAPGAGWSSRARPAACASTTATPTTRSRSPATSQAARALAGEGRLVVAFQPHLVSRTRIFGAAMGEALGAADEVVVLDVYLAREDADPEVTGALVADAVPLPRRAGRLRARPRRRRRARSSERARPGDLVLTLGAGDVTEVGPRVLELLAEVRRCLADRATGPATPREPQPQPQRFARRQWARRWLAWRYVVAVAARWSRSSVGVGLAGVLLRPRCRSSGSRSSAPSCSATRAGRARPPPCPSGEPLARVDLDRDPGPGRGAGRGARPPTSPAQWPDSVLIDGRRARGRRGRRDRRPAPRAWTPTAWCSATTPGARRAAPRADRRPTPAATRCSEARRWWSRRCPTDLAARVDHVEVATVDQITLVLRDGRDGAVGERGRVRR